MRINEPWPRYLLAVLALALAACGPAASGDPATQSSGPTARAGPKRMTAAILGDPRTLRNTVNAAGGSGATPGLEVVEELLTVGLVTLDDRGGLNPRLAEAVPTVDNGLWKVFPDGRMETTWNIKPSARWHDGAPVTSEDMVFTATVSQDRELAIFRDAVFESIEAVLAPDPSTLTVLWKKPFIDADLLFTPFTATNTVPLPRHVLGSTYADDKASLTLLPYWGAEFVGTGPFKLRELALGSHLILEANDTYFLGRPRIDEIEVRFIPDSNTLIGNILAGAVETALGRNVSLEQGLQVRAQWKGGRVEVAPTLWMAIYPQFLTPNPAVVADARFRRALLHAVDRQQMVETIQAGLGTVAHSLLAPEIPEYRDVERGVVRYEFDLRRASQLIEEIGYVRGADGVLRDATDRRLSLELRTTKEAHNEEALYPVADYWQRLGVEVEPLVIPPQRISDRAFRAQYPGFEVIGQSNTIKGLARLRLAQTPLPETNFAGLNRARYMNSEFESLLERYFTTIPKSERGQALADVIHHMTDQLVWMGLYHEVNPTILSDRLVNIGPRVVEATQAWNAHEWDVRELQ